MTDRIPVLVNAGGGTARSLGDRCQGEVERAFAEAGAKVNVRLLPGADIPAAAAELAGHEVVVVGGGDGTLGGSAGALAKGGATLGILPLGTRNHLAKELGIPMGLDEAARLIAAGPRRRIDLGRVNGHGFVNNASIGAYPELVEAREAAPGPKWLATLPATIAVLRRLRHHRLRLRYRGEDKPVMTPLLFVGNNRYQLDAGRLGERAALDAGRLSVFALAPQRRLGLIGFGMRTLLGRVDPARDFAELAETTALTVEGHPARIAVALDGEVTRLALPLRFTIEPGGLTVVAPLEGAGTTP